MIIWITGLSGSGKTTLAQALSKSFWEDNRPNVVLDGDEIRKAFGFDLGYSVSDRIQHIERIQRLAQLLSEQRVDVIVAALYCNESLLNWNRVNYIEYFEIYLKAPLSLLEKRDFKGLYQKARTGELNNVVGFDIPWEAPQSPDLVLDIEKISHLQMQLQAVLEMIFSHKVSIHYESCIESKS